MSPSKVALLWRLLETAGTLTFVEYMENSLERKDNSRFVAMLGWLQTDLVEQKLLRINLTKTDRSEHLPSTVGIVTRWD
jgi:hypothetical protein